MQRKLDWEGGNICVCVFVVEVGEEGMHIRPYLSEILGQERNIASCKEDPGFEMIS